MKKINTDEWKPIDGYEDRYMVSVYGEIASINNGFRILKQEVKDHNGIYARINLSKNGKSKHHSVHRLVANAFLPNLNEKPEIDHIDGNPLNNHVSNLRWVTRSENEMNPITRKRISIANKGRSITWGDKISKTMKGRVGKLCNRSIPVNQYSIDGKYIKTFESSCIASRELGIGQSSIWSCVHGKYKTAGGFIWKNL